jgi:LacI family transcriptional regulator
VIHDRGEVSVKTRDKILSILEEMHYEPDILARSLASRQPFRIAVLLPYHSPENRFWKEPLAGINEACTELMYFGLEVREFLYDQFAKQEFAGRAAEVLDYCPDAVIAAPVFHQETQEFFDRCSRSGIPFVSLNDNIRHPDQVSYVGQDPHRSGAVAGHLIRTGMKGEGRLLVVSIAGDKDNYNHILNREKGFLEYWESPGGTNGQEIITRAIPTDNYTYIKRSLGELFGRYHDIRGIFVTNSRVYQVARFLEDSGRKDVMLVGYDLIDPNIAYLNNGVIDFLISQKPREQGYRALMAVFNTLKLNKKPMPEQLIPIDIICRENLCCYQV